MDAQMDWWIEEKNIPSEYEFLHKGLPDSKAFTFTPCYESGQ